MTVNMVNETMRKLSSQDKMDGRMKQKPRRRATSPLGEEVRKNKFILRILYLTRENYKEKRKVK